MVVHCAHPANGAGLPLHPTMEWLKTLGVAGFLFFLLKGLAWLLVFFLISRGVIKRRQLALMKLKWRKFLRPQKAKVKENQGAAKPSPSPAKTPTSP